MTGIDARLRPELDALAHTEHLLVAVDFDGTLAPIVVDPAQARATAEAVEALEALAALPRTTVAVVSGRSLHDLAAVAGLPSSVRLVGSHGAELAVGEVDGLDADATARRTSLIADVGELVDGVEGVRVEDKAAGVAVHVREASRDDAARVLEEVRSGPATAEGVRSIEGHEVLELTVVETGKGKAVEALRTACGATGMLVAGDDVTDEAMLEGLRDGDVGIRVGPGPTAAGHRVPHPHALAAVLADLARTRASAHPTP